MIENAQRARDRGDLREAERLCIDVFIQVEMGVIQALFDYAAMLQSAGSPEAQPARARAERYREIKTRPQAGSVYLGWDPAEELHKFSILLGQAGRNTEAQMIVRLSDAYARMNLAHFRRQVMQSRGEDPRGIC